MAQVTVTIHNKEFTIACQDGQEEILNNVAEQLNEKVSTLSQSFPTAETEYLMVFANLMMADEIKALKSKLEMVEQKQKQDVDTAVLSLRLENIATKIENIASQLESIDS